MTPRPVPLPRPLLEHLFTPAQARTFGVSDRRLRAGDLTAPYRGVRAPSTRSLSLVERCRARALTLPAAAAFGAVTAARLHRMPLPLALTAGGVLHVDIPTGRRAPRGKGVVGHQVDLPDDDVVMVDGVRCTTPARTFCDLAMYVSLAELVAVGDHLIRRRGGTLTASDLLHAVDRHGTRRGGRRLRRALQLLDDGAESPKESELRVALIEARMPRPECNIEVRDENGCFVARVDLAYRQARIVLEYEGDHHRDPTQWRKDLARRRRLEALGWLYLSVTQADLTDPTALLADLRAAFARPLSPTRR